MSNLTGQFYLSILPAHENRIASNKHICATLNNLYKYTMCAKTVLLVLLIQDKYIFDYFIDIL